MMKTFFVFLVLSILLGCTLNVEELKDVADLNSNDSQSILVNTSNKQFVIEDVTKDVTSVASDLDSLAESI